MANEYERCKLAWLESAFEDGTLPTTVPLQGYEDKVVEEGLAISNGEWSEYSIQFWITDKGREYVKKNIPPAEW